MITASTLLTLIPNLPATTRGILDTLVKQAGNPEIHIPGLPSLPPLPSQVPDAVRAAVVAALGDFEFEFYQTLGVRVAKGGAPLGGVGVRVSEGVNVKSPAPNVRIVPVLELGAPKD